MAEGIKNALLIYNPTSGRKRHRRFEEIEKAVAILREAGISTEIAATTAPGTARGMAQLAVAQRRDLVIACGGDGTVNEVVNGLAGSQVPMALLPAGTANILAKELGVPWDIPHAARLIPGGTVRRIALGIACPPEDNGNGTSRGQMVGRYFLCVAGAGPDGAIVNGVDEIFKKNAGILAYWAEGLKQLFRYDFPEMWVHSGGQERRATIVVIGRTAHYGGPFKITTGASLFEDSFEMVTNAATSRFQYLRCLPALWMGKLRTVKGIDAWKQTEVICEPTGERMIFAQVDGEPIGALPLAFRIAPNALSIVVPGKTVASG
jgi:diacylglycerol kinase (ATP)